MVGRSPRAVQNLSRPGVRILRADYQHRPQWFSLEGRVLVWKKQFGIGLEMSYDRSVYNNP
jgi:hypothetical protein